MTIVSRHGGMRAEGKRDANEVDLRPWALGTTGDQGHRKGGGTPQCDADVLEAGLADRSWS